MGSTMALINCICQLLIIHTHHILLNTNKIPYNTTITSGTFCVPAGVCHVGSTHESLALSVAH